MKNKKTIENSFIGASLGHLALCPIHGILPKIALVAGSGSSLAETKLGKAGEWIHEKEENGLAYLISKFHKEPYKNVEGHDHGHYHAHAEHKHENNYSSQVLNQAHFTTHALNWALVGYSAYILARRIYHKFKKK